MAQQQADPQQIIARHAAQFNQQQEQQLLAVSLSWNPTLVTSALTLLLLLLLLLLHLSTDYHRTVHEKVPWNVRLKAGVEGAGVHVELL